MVNQRRRRPGGRRFFPRRKVCQFCVDKVTVVSYKDVPRLRRFISDWGKIESRRKSGTCAPHQRQLSLAIKRARYLALLPYTGAHSLVELTRPDTRRDDRRRERPGQQEQRPAADAAARQTETPAEGASSEAASGAAATAEEAPAREAAPEAPAPTATAETSDSTNS